MTADRLPEINARAFDAFTRVGVACSVITDVLALRASPLLPAAILAVDTARVAGEQACETSAPTLGQLTQFAQLARAADQMLNTVAELIDDRSVWCATFEMQVAATTMTEVEELVIGFGWPAGAGSSSAEVALLPTLQPLVSKLSDLLHNAYDHRVADVGQDDAMGTTRILENIAATVFGIVSAPASDYIWQDPGMSMLPILCLVRDHLELVQSMGVALPLALQLTMRLIEVVSPVEDAEKLEAALECARELEDGTLAAFTRSPPAAEPEPAARAAQPGQRLDDSHVDQVHSMLQETHAIMCSHVEELDVDDGEVLYAIAFLIETALTRLGEARGCQDAQAAFPHLEDCDLFMNRAEVTLQLLNTEALADSVLYGAARLIGFARAAMARALDEALAQRRAAAA